LIVVIGLPKSGICMIQAALIEADPATVH